MPWLLASRLLVMVNLFGIMFESKFLRTGSAPYEALANATLGVILTSLAYLFSVLWSEIIVAIFPGLKCNFIQSIVDNDEEDDDNSDDDESVKSNAKSKKRAFFGGRNKNAESDVTRKKKSGTDKRDGKKTVEFELEMSDLELNQNPLYAQGRNRNDTGLSDDDLNKVVKNHPDFLAMTQTLQQQQDELRGLKVSERASEASES